MSSRAIRILVAEDHGLVRDALVSVLERRPGLEIVASTPSIRESRSLIERHRPDLVLADLCLEDGSAVQLVRALRRPRRRTRVLLMTGFNDCLAAWDLEQSGAAGLILKEQSTEDLFTAIETVAAGGRYVPPALQGWTRGPAGDEVRRIASLSRREREVFRMVTAGFQTSEIARRLFLSTKTVDTHRAKINQKLGVHTPAALVRFAHTQGIVVGPRRHADEPALRTAC